MGNVFGKPFTIHPVLKEVASIFSNEGKQLYLVGGAVRDSLRGYKAHDWDLATDALPEEVISMFGKRRNKSPKASSSRAENLPPGCFVVPTGIKHGTVTVHYKGRIMEVTTFRTESNYSDGRRPDKVEFGATIEEDLSRRDFTMNAIAYKLPDGPLVDPFGGKADIKARIIRTVGKAEERFSEDGLRPLRAVRFASQLDFKPDEKLLEAIPAALPLCAQVASERIRDELDKIINSAKPSIGFLLMEKTGLLELLVPELMQCRGIEQKGFHRFDVLDHSLLALDYAAKNDMPHEVRLASLYHDLGKPATRKLDEAGHWTFHQHEKESSRLARIILLRFKYPRAVIEKVCHLIEEHMFFYEDNWKDSAVRRFIIRVGEENLNDLYKVRQADSFALAGKESPPDSLLPLVYRVDAILAEKKALTLKDLAISGNDLTTAGISPGKRMGLILKELLEAVLDDPDLNTREKLLEIALKLNQ
ncbi:MAG: CCA tRNA nucleotidyltransferase [Treponema sp.]|jgi:tRNA nucleotidyltransferase/poly(A) polymerase|nr:CCA tRNA nucleotidyltransferase [Treponema sp.]